MPDDRSPATPPRIPRASYRLQFNRSFTFRDATRLVPYLQRLGISDLYASPYLRARPGSLHGYDVFDHNALNPEVGSDAEYRELASVAREHDMGHLLDIVPNHMGIAGEGNAWWVDVLENGPSSPYAPFFDIDWRPLRPTLAGKVLLPVLGDQFGLVLERGELRLAYENGRFWIEYFDSRFPVAPRSSSGVLGEALRLLRPGRAADDEAVIELESIMTALRHLPPRDRTDPASVAERQRERLVSRRRIHALAQGSADVRAALAAAIERFNGEPGDAHSFDLLHELLEDQAYRLAYWRVAAEEINYRRFFDINDLAGVRVERPDVFDATHRLVLRLVADGAVTGLRIDHPDGLYDPPGYLRQLQHACTDATGSQLYLLVEKILSGDEALHDDWPVAGTVGYDFLDRAGALFVDPSAEREMDEAYARFVGRTPDFGELVYRRKKLILGHALASELTVLADLLDRLSEQNRRVRDFTLGSLTQALRETIACFPVYRTYVDAHTGHLGDDDRRFIEQAVRAARRRNPALSRQVFDFLQDLLLLRWPELLDDEARSEHARFVMKFQQLTGPVMAKGVEDTSFYIYNRLVSLNEVGGEPHRFGLEPAEYHRWIARRAERWPHTMNTTSTHDTKRSEDVRARIHVLSELCAEWSALTLAWAALHAPLGRIGENDGIPDRNDEYLLYQTLVGVWPLDEELDGDAYAELTARVQAYMEKATREAKVHTSWINPNDEYDAGLHAFVAAVLDRERNPEFFASFLPFQRRVAALGMLNSLAQTLLKLTCPGLPDVYQGQEVWDFSLVDPDNRRPVDHAIRAQLLESLRARLDRGDRERLARELVHEWRDGRIKLFVTHLALLDRARRPDVYAQGGYEPLYASGPAAAHVVAFARRHATGCAVVAVPRLVCRLYGHDGFQPARREVWAETFLEGPADVLDGLTHLFTGTPAGAVVDGARARVPVAELLGVFPVALLAGAGAR